MCRVFYCLSGAPARWRCRNVTAGGYRYCTRPGDEDSSTYRLSKSSLRPLRRSVTARKRSPHATLVEGQHLTCMNLMTCNNFGYNAAMDRNMWIYSVSCRLFGAA
jgi:hypothetical protein